MIKSTLIIPLVVLMFVLATVLSIVVLKTECPPWLAFVIFSIGCGMAMVLEKLHKEIEFMKYKKIYDKAYRD